MSKSSTPVPKRRTNPPRRAKEAVDAATDTGSDGSSSNWTSETTTPPVPNSTEAMLLAIYPVTLVLGSAFSLLSPETRHGTYDAAAQAYADAATLSYFARKSNVFNVFFVKRGWFWVTLAFAGFAGTRALRRAERHKSVLGTRRTAPTAPPLLPPAVQALVRWLLATAWWFGTTQWCFGAPLIDRGFRWTGGRCHVVLARGPNDLARGNSPAQDAEQLVTAAACRAIGGAWRGGHDISGHVFLLTLGSAFLAMEILPAVLGALRASAEDESAAAAAAAAAEDRNDNKDKERRRKEPAEQAVRYATTFAALVGLMCLWMLLMTAVYFHTWFEKFTGLAVAFSSIASIYFLPRLFPALRRVVGAPSL